MASKISSMLLILFFSTSLFAKSNVISHAPTGISVIPTNEGAKISWTLNLPDTVLSFNNSKPWGKWGPHLNQALGCVFDLSEFPNATLEQIDFVHYSRELMHGPYYYRILFFDMDSSKLFYTIDSLVAGDSYDLPRFEIGVPLGSVPARNKVGIFIQGLSSPDSVNTFPALMSDSSAYIPGISYYLVDVNDPFLKKDPNYTNFWELFDISPNSTNFILDLWININGSKINVSRNSGGIPYPGVPDRASSFYLGELPAEKAARVNRVDQSGIIDGFYVYRGDTTESAMEVIATVDPDLREFLDTTPLTDSSYFYAVSSFNSLTTSLPTRASYYQPKIMKISESKIDDNNDFIPDLLGSFVALRGTIVSPNFSGSLQYFLNDQTGGILLYSPDFTAELQIGDSVFVAGYLTQYKGLTELKIDSIAFIQKLGTHSFDTLKLTLSEINESVEGRLAVFDNLQIVNPAEWPTEGKNGSKVKVTDSKDTLALFIDKDTDLDGWTPPSGKFRLVAIVDQYTSLTPADEGYELRPRFRTDFIPSTGIGFNETGIAERFFLQPCYPNPFNPRTNIHYQLPKRSLVQIRIFDIQGRLVEELMNETQNPGQYTIPFTADDLASGIYLLFFKAGTFTNSQKLILIK